MVWWFEMVGIQLYIYPDISRYLQISPDISRFHSNLPTLFFGIAVPNHTRPVMRNWDRLVGWYAFRDSMMRLEQKVRSHSIRRSTTWSCIGSVCHRIWCWGTLSELKQSRSRSYGDAPMVFPWSQLWGCGGLQRMRARPAESQINNIDAQWVHKLGTMQRS